MRELVIASGNAGKVKEISSIVEGVRLLSLQDISFTDEIPEPFDTFHENAHTKAETIHRYCWKDVFADDSGLVVPALNGAPGVISAHYAGFPRSDERNIQKLLAELEHVTDRSAMFTTIICLIWNNETYYFEGTCKGAIINEPRGDKGFGYDPVFVPAGYDRTFAELSLDEKNMLSHRGEAVRKMAAFIRGELNRAGT